MLALLLVAVSHCEGRWRGAISLGFGADGKRIRRKVSGKTKAIVQDRLKTLHGEAMDTLFIPHASPEAARVAGMPNADHRASLAVRWRPGV
jgi:hypothetical protein